MKLDKKYIAIGTGVFAVGVVIYFFLKDKASRRPIGIIDDENVDFDTYTTSEGGAKIANSDDENNDEEDDDEDDDEDATYLQNHYLLQHQILHLHYLVKCKIFFLNTLHIFCQLKIH